MKHYTLKLIFLWMLIIPSANWAKPPEVELPKPQAFSKPYGYHLEPILKRIKANPEQRTKITAIVMAYRPQIEPLRKQYQQESQAFLSWVTSGVAAEQIMSKEVELGHLYSDIVAKYCLMRLEIRRLLAPQQIILFEDYRRQQGWSK